ncbi:MAG: TIGR03915 family putative DNA repair protein, partial [Bacilli bacterium]|nr:TIGR03915 family putative DNA repair protein [Bacilli bacterium]
SLIYKNKIFYMHKISWVNNALKISKYVSRENHKLKGFLRFKELKSGALYAEISPTNNILPILVKHFRARLKNEYWLIKDTKRNILAIYDKKEVYLVDGEYFNFIIDDYSEYEENIQDMWKSFYKTIGIESRKNDRCRRNFMPKKYWKYIIEMSEEK